MPSRAVWLKAAEALLANHDVSLAVLPVEEILGQKRLMTELYASGYQRRGQSVSGNAVLPVAP